MAPFPRLSVEVPRIDVSAAQQSQLHFHSHSGNTSESTASSTSIHNPHVYLELSIGGIKAGRMVFELFADIVPKTAENFRCLCTGEKSPKLHFKNSTFHRVIKGFMAQGGDITNYNGTGCVSIYGRRGSFRDENFEAKHSGRGILSMANSGPNTNGSQFFITLRATPHLDGEHVVFGRLVSGNEVLDKIEGIKTNNSDQPTHQYKVTIIGCGEIKEERKKGTEGEERKKETEGEERKKETEGEERKNETEGDERKKETEEELMPTATERGKGQVGDGDGPSKEDKQRKRQEDGGEKKGASDLGIGGGKEEGQTKGNKNKAEDMLEQTSREKKRRST